MNNEQQMVLDFHKKYSCVVKSSPETGSTYLRFLRSRLILEEAVEFMTAANNEDQVLMVDSLCDLLYVVYGTAVVMGIDLEPIFAEVHRSNMTKTGGNDNGGKVVKGPDYEPPNIEELIKKQKPKKSDNCLKCGAKLIATEEEYCANCYFQINLLP